MTRPAPARVPTAPRSPARLVVFAALAGCASAVNGVGGPDAAADAALVRDVVAVDRGVPPADAARTDASPPAACTLRRTDGPVAIHRHGDAGPYHAPSVVWNPAEGVFEAFATFVAEDDLWVSQVELRRFRVDAAGRVALSPDDASHVVATTGSESRAVRAGDYLALCTSGDAPGSIVFGGTAGPATGLVLRPVLAGAESCSGLASDGGRWLLTAQVRRADGSATDPVTALFASDGAPLQPAYRIPGAEPDKRIATESLAGGFAGGYATPDRQLVAGWTRGAEAGRGTSVPAPGARGDVSPAIARWPDDGSSFALVPSVEAGPHRVHVFDSRGVSETARVTVGGFSMGGDTSPAAVVTPWGLVVAVAGWGDFDPNNGQLQLTLVTREFAAHPAPDALSINRAPGVVAPGARDRLAGGTDGGNVVIVWAGRERQGAGERATFAAVYRCE